MNTPTERVTRKLLLGTVGLLTAGALQLTGDARWCFDVAVLGAGVPLAVQRVATIAVERRWTPLLALLGELPKRPALPPAEDERGVV